MITIGEHLAILRQAVLTLTPTGPTGFEGLIATVLAKICGCPFRVAASGSQRGRDGSGTTVTENVYFEAKLYSQSISMSVIAGKIMEVLLRDDGSLDTWILAATIGISDQTASDCKAMLQRQGVGFLLLDWADTAELPTLSLALAMGGNATRTFLATASLPDAKVDDALLAIESHPAFAAHSIVLQRGIAYGALGLELARQENRQWLDARFANRRQSRQRFGQPLAPFDSTGPARIARPSLRSKLDPAFQGPPVESVFAVVGEEGVGKSWLVPESWASTEPRPLLVVATAAELQPVISQDIEPVLLAKLAEQTGRGRDEYVEARWRRRINAWRMFPSPNQTRLAVLVDGLNQSPTSAWPAWLDAAAGFLAKVGGNLIVTTRITHFQRHIQRQLTTDVLRVDVAEWTDAELKTLLRDAGVDIAHLNVTVRTALRNPRLAGLALELLDSSAMESLSELSVERLLFEYLMRAEQVGSASLDPVAFATLLAKLGKTVFDRVVAQHIDDLKLFSLHLDARLLAVVDTRFFSSMPGDTDHYEIRTDGLTLALGLWLVNVLRREVRNHRDPDEELTRVLEPISTLDCTAEVLAAAIEATVQDEATEPDIIAVLLRRYTDLQNLDHERHGAFLALARTVPQAFLLASRDSALADTSAPNEDVLFHAIRRAGNTASPMVIDHTNEWLSYYSLAPERRMFTLRRGAPSDEVTTERSATRDKIEATLRALTSHERNFLSRRLMRHDNGNLANLHELAFRLLAGRPLAGIAAALVNWSFAEALNPSLDSARDDFLHLVRMNRCDWAQTRDVLLKESQVFRSPNTSHAGRWALVYVLRATGDERDGDEAEAVADELTRDRERLPSWRYIESYCNTDPCDPASPQATNVATTAERLRALDASSLSTGASMKENDYFLRDAKPGIVRFAPQAAIDVYRRLSIDVTQRQALSRQWGVFELASHSAALDPSLLIHLTEMAQSSTAVGMRADGTGFDEWLTAQYSLASIIPHLSGDEQLAILADMKSSSLLVPLLNSTKIATPSTLEAVLAKAVTTNNIIAQRNVVSFLHRSRTPVTRGTAAILSTFLTSPDVDVRIGTMGVAAATQDKELVRRFAELEWTAASLGSGDLHERWYGSLLLITAATAGLVAPEDILHRITPGCYGIAAAKLGSSVAPAIVECVAVLFTAVEPDWNQFQVPHAVNQPVVDPTREMPPLMSLDDDRTPQTLEESLMLFNEGPDEFDTRQKRTWDAVHRMRQDLETAGWGLALEDVTIPGMGIVVNAAHDLVESWRDALLACDSPKLSAMHLLGLQLVATTIDRDPAALPLLRRLLDTAPLMRRSTGVADLPYQAFIAWSLSHLRDVREICFQRIDLARNDQEIAIESLAALSSGRGDVLLDYVRSRTVGGEPSVLCKALMVAGYSEPSDELEALIDFKQTVKGFVGSAARAARYAYERNVWSHEWYSRMRTANDPAEFWRSAVLLAKIVDGRYSAWSYAGQTSSTFDAFISTVGSAIRQRIDKWNQKRRHTLFGGKVPDDIFVRSSDQSPAGMRES